MSKLRFELQAIVKKIANKILVVYFFPHPVYSANYAVVDILCRKSSDNVAF